MKTRDTLKKAILLGKWKDLEEYECGELSSKSIIYIVIDAFAES